jgi:hypothetical protein
VTYCTENGRLRIGEKITVAGCRKSLQPSPFSEV